MYVIPKAFCCSAWEEWVENVEAALFICEKKSDRVVIAVIGISSNIKYGKPKKDA